MMLTRSESASASLRMWLLSSTVRPWARSSRTQPRNVSSISGSSPLVGSSSRNSSASVARAATRATFCRLPLEYVRAFLRGVQLEQLQQPVAPGGVLAALQPAQQVDHLAAGQVRPQRHVARDVGQPAVQRRHVAPGVQPQHPDGAGVRTQQAQQEPQVVDLPAPLGPRKPCTSPAATSKSSPSRAVTDPKRFTTPLISTTLPIVNKVRRINGPVPLQKVLVFRGWVAVPSLVSGGSAAVIELFHATSLVRPGHPDTFRVSPERAAAGQRRQALQRARVL